jgi:hypothetical protein
MQNRVERVRRELVKVVEEEEKKKHKVDHEVSGSLCTGSE